MKAAAILTIHDPANMTPKGKRDVLRWLRRQLGFFEKHNDQMAKRFTARYLYRSK